MGPSVRLVDPAAACAKTVTSLLQKDSSLTRKISEPPRESARCHYFVSDDPNKFQDLSRRLFGLHSAHVEKVELTFLSHYSALGPV